MAIQFKRCDENPIVVPGLFPWRRATVFNPGCIYDEGNFWLYERAAGGLRPFSCYIGLLQSDDGIHFRHVSDQPVFTPEMAGSKYGSVQDPRVVRIDGTYYMTYAYRPYAFDVCPTGVGAPNATQPKVPGWDGDYRTNQTRSGIAVSTDRIHWRHHSWPTELELDDRDVILFPDKINGRFALLRRPLQFVGPKYGTEYPGIWICFSEDLHTWSEPELLIKPAFKWEDNRIGGSTPPIRTERGWLVLYHGVENQDPSIKRVCYRLGAMMLDLDDPRKVIARTPEAIMEPEKYYERFGLWIPNVIFPTANVVKDGLLYLYYGCCDTCISLATVAVGELVEHVMKCGA